MSPPKSEQREGSARPAQWCDEVQEPGRGEPRTDPQQTGPSESGADSQETGPDESGADPQETGPSESAADPQETGPSESAADPQETGRSDTDGGSLHGARPRAPATTRPTGPQRTASPNARAVALARAAGVAAFVVIVDQLTKHLIRSGIPVGNIDRFILGIKLVHVRNTGVAFSLFSGGGTLVLVITLCALALLVAYLILRPTRQLLWLPTGMLVGGAIGNLIDRISSGAVTDFIKLPAWPAFNCADISITFGVLVLLWVLERRQGETR